MCYYVIDEKVALSLSSVIKARSRSGSYDIGREDLKVEDYP